MMILAAMAAALPAQAALTNGPNDIHDPNVVGFSAYDGLMTTGPEAIAPGVVFTGALVNHYELGNLLPFSVVVSAYGDNNQIIETHTLMIDTDEASLNEGLFIGIARPTADIRSIAFKGNYLVVDDFTFTTPVPEGGLIFPTYL